MAVVLFLLFYPFSCGNDASPWKDVLPYGIHAGMWAGLVWSFWPVARGRRGGQWLLFALLVLAGGASEAVQGFVGRTPEWLDWGMDALGAGIAFVWGCGHRKTGLGLAAAVGAVLLACVGFRTVEEWRAYPVLADCNQRWSRYRWERNGVSMRVGKRFFRVRKAAKGETAYPGIFRFPIRGDWRGSRGMELDVYWPANNGTPAVLGVRVDDREGNPPYGDRYQAELPVTNGWNRLVANRDWMLTPDGREMDVRHIHTWGVFVVASPRTNYFGVARAVLLTDGERGGDFENTAP